MINPIEKLANYFIRSGVVDKEDHDIYIYGFKLLFAEFFHIVTILTIGWLANEFLSITVFLLVYKCIREYSGGYHSKSSQGCYLLTVLVTVFVSASFKFDVLHSWSLLISLVSGSIIWFLSPQETENKPLENWELPCYRRKSRIILVLSEILILTFHVLYPLLEKGIVYALLIQSIMLLISITERTIKQSSKY